MIRVKSKKTDSSRFQLKEHPCEPKSFTTSATYLPNESQSLTLHWQMEGRNYRLVMDRAEAEWLGDRLAAYRAHWETGK